MKVPSSMKNLHRTFPLNMNFENKKPTRISLAEIHDSHNDAAWSPFANFRLLIPSALCMERRVLEVPATISPLLVLSTTNSPKVPNDFSLNAKELGAKGLLLMADRKQKRLSESGLFN